MEIVRYGLQLPDGSLARVGLDSAPGGGYVLSSQPGWPTFEVDTLDEIKRLLFNPPGSLSGTRDRPSLGRYSRDVLRPVKLVTRVEVEPVEIPLPIVLDRVVDDRKIPPILAKSRLGEDVELPRGELRQIVAALPWHEDGSVRAIQAGDIVQTLILGWPYETFRVVGVTDVPDIWGPDFRDSPGVLLIGTPLS